MFIGLSSYRWVVCPTPHFAPGTTISTAHWFSHRVHCRRLQASTSIAGSTLCLFFPASKPIRRVYSDQSHRKYAPAISTLSGSRALTVRTVFGLTCKSSTIAHGTQTISVKRYDCSAGIRIRKKTRAGVFQLRDRQVDRALTVVSLKRRSNSPTTRRISSNDGTSPKNISVCMA